MRKGITMDTQEPTAEQIAEYVIAAHGNFDKVKTLLAANPALLNTRWAQFDESALDAAGHTGRRAIAEYLLAAGMAPTIFAAAMLGQTEQVRAFLEADPALARADGVHGISLLYHAAMSGKTELGDLLLEYGGGSGADHALHAATLFGHADMLGWLLAHGVQNVDAPNYEGKTPLQVALERGDDRIAGLLRRHGGTAALAS
jgi:ankyrin repeat protein